MVSKTFSQRLKGGRWQLWEGAAADGSKVRNRLTLGLAESCLPFVAGKAERLAKALSSTHGNDPNRGLTEEPRAGSLVAGS